MTQLADKPISPVPGEERGSVPAHASPRPPAQTVHLNAFQGLMRRWSKLHPYNAGQVMRVSGPPDREKWKQAAEEIISELGLGRPRFMGGVGASSSEHSVSFVPVDEIVIEQSACDLQTFFNEELNRSFAAGDLPIRLCILPGKPPPTAGQSASRNGERFHSGDHQGESHYLAAVYDHWIADSRAMRDFMHRLFERYRDPVGQSPALAPLTLLAPPFNRLFGRHIGALKRFAAMRESLKNIWRHRHAYRVNLVEPLDFNSRFMLRELPPGLITKIHRYAKTRAASVNDLFIAVIGQTMAAATSDDRLHRSKKPLHFTRRHVGIGTIVDIRDAASEPLDRVFNLYLSSYTVVLVNAEFRPVPQLLAQVAGETTRMKKTRATVRGFWALVMARFWYDVYDSQRFRASLLHKTVPVVAGISNVNMTSGWADPAATSNPPGLGDSAAPGTPAPRVLDYLRISPTGPLIPLVFTLTTIADRLSLCVTFRTTAFSERKLSEIMNDFIRRLEAIE